MSWIADVLADAREYIEQGGWIQGSLGEKGGSVCVIGGIIWSQGWAEATGCVDPNHMHDLEMVQRAVLDVVEKETHVYYDEIPAWNDDEATTEQHVLDVLAKAEKIDRAGYDPDAP